MVYLLIISFILHFISFYFIVILHQKQKHQQPIDHSKSSKEIEDLLIAYTTEMKENNERLARQINKMNMKPVQTSVRTEENAQKEEPTKSPNHNQKPQQTSIKEPSNTNRFNEHDAALEEDKQDSDYSSYVPPAPVEETDTYVEPSTASKVLALSEKGYEVQDIAKQLKMGAGEVELLLKFNK
ncbi:hypothetical protein LGQ02_12570 [Bacillus shivajii]|uniref:hypothetical protein n=1 Tax=Bacillus shivajii TaxID=1983719 RepID=UPI001CFB72D5|nr:hypothetical protein [Bacillus shivajii]UCZ51698.1 hypothetical protein LGQ02_12570 [Bacillus shivajii]